MYPLRARTNSPGLRARSTSACQPRVVPGSNAIDVLMMELAEKPFCGLQHAERVANGKRIAASPRREVGHRSRDRRLPHIGVVERECYHEHIDRHVEGARNRRDIRRLERARRVDAIGDDDQRPPPLPVRNFLRGLRDGVPQRCRAVRLRRRSTPCRSRRRRLRTAALPAAPCRRSTARLRRRQASGPPRARVAVSRALRHLRRHASAGVHQDGDARGARLRPHITQRPLLAVVVQLEVAALQILDQAAARVADLCGHSDLLDAAFEDRDAGSCAAAVPAASAARSVSDRKSRRINTLSVIGQFHCTSQGRRVPALA